MLSCRQIIVVILIIFTASACSRRQAVYTSECSAGIAYRKVSFDTLVAHLKAFDKQYVEVTGKYVEGKNLSALLNNSTLIDQGSKKALWVNFSQDCPLILTGTNTGLFEYGDGNFSKISNHIMVIRGRVDFKQKGHLNAYSGAIDMVSYVEVK